MVYSGELTGLTVRLRSVNVDDAYVTYKMRTDREKTKYMHSMEGSLEDQKKYIQNQMKKPGDYLFAVLNDNDEVIGMRGIYNVSEKSAESGRTIGYGDAFQNMEALLIGFDFAFDKLGVDKIYMDAAAENASIRGIQTRIGAKEYKRGYLEGLDYEFVFSVLSKDDYEKNRPLIMSMIEKHSKKKAGRNYGK